MSKLRKFIVFGILESVMLLASTVCCAQGYATLTGTVIDPDTNHWAYATWSANLVNISGPIVDICGGTIKNQLSGQLDSTGTFVASGDAIIVAKNACISPPTTQWQFTVCPAISIPCVVYTATSINVSSFNAGSYLSPLTPTPRFVSFFGGQGYATLEATHPKFGDTFYLTASSTLDCYGTSWSNCTGTGLGINQLTGDGTAGPGAGSQVLTAVKLPGHVALSGTPATGLVPTATDATHATWQAVTVSAPTGCPAGASSNASCYLITNDATGTTLNLAACWAQSGYPQQTIHTCPHQSQYGTDNPIPFVGIVVAGAGT